MSVSSLAGYLTSNSGLPENTLSHCVNLFNSIQKQADIIVASLELLRVSPSLFRLEDLNEEILILHNEIWILPTASSNLLLSGDSRGQTQTPSILNQTLLRSDVDIQSDSPEPSFSLVDQDIGHPANGQDVPAHL